VIKQLRMKVAEILREYWLFILIGVTTLWLLNPGIFSDMFESMEQYWVTVLSL